MIFIMIDERVNPRDLEPMIDSRWADKAADVLRFDRGYAEAGDWLARFNQVNIPLVMELNFILKNLRASVDNAHQRLPEGLESLRAFMKETYPGRRAIRVNPINKEGSTK